MGEAIVAALVAAGLFVVVPLWRWRARVYRNACVAVCDAIYGIATPYGRLTTFAMAFTYQMDVTVRPVVEGLTKMLVEVRNAMEPMLQALAEMGIDP